MPLKAERLVWLRHRADGGSLKTRSRLFLWFISFGRAKEMNNYFDNFDIS